MNNEVRGYSLFNDVEDKEIQVYNRARSMKNIMMDNADEKKNVSLKGALTLQMYMKSIPEEDRREVFIKLEELLKQKEIV